MIKTVLTIQNRLGLHTRAAAKLVNIAKKFESQIELVYHDRSVDAKSIMGVITLGTQKDHILEIVLTGKDEEEAMMAITDLINNKFGEE